MTWLQNLSVLEQVTLLIVVGLCVASAIIWTVKFNPKQAEELKQRIKSWWVIFAILLGALWSPEPLTFVFFAFVSFLALKEYLSLIPTRRTDRRVLLWAYLAIPAQYYFAYDGWYGMFIIFIPVWMFLLLPIRMLLIGETKGFLRALSELQWGLMINVFGLSHLAYLYRLNFIEPNVAGPAALVLYLFLITELNDVFQYISGKLFGRRKIMPKVSPNKTWEGFIGGLLLTTALSTVLAPWMTPIQDIGMAALLGAVLAFTGFFGDTTISAVKRDLGVKDSGNLLPGHGGILDRLDSLCFTTLVYFHFLNYFYT